jgi:hypothetical protein
LLRLASVSKEYSSLCHFCERESEQRVTWQRWRPSSSSRRWLRFWLAASRCTKHTKVRLSSAQTVTHAHISPFSDFSGVFPSVPCPRPLIEVCVAAHRQHRALKARQQALLVGKHANTHNTALQSKFFQHGQGSLGCTSSALQQEAGPRAATPTDAVSVFVDGVCAHAAPNRSRQNKVLTAPTAVASPLQTKDSAFFDDSPGGQSTDTTESSSYAHVDVSASHSLPRPIVLGRREPTSCPSTLHMPLGERAEQPSETAVEILNDKTSKHIQQGTNGDGSRSPEVIEDQQRAPFSPSLAGVALPALAADHVARLTQTRTAPRPVLLGRRASERMPVEELC